MEATIHARSARVRDAMLSDMMRRFDVFSAAYAFAYAASYSLFFSRCLFSLLSRAMSIHAFTPV